MRKFAFAIFALEAVLLLALMPAPRVDAGELLARTLDASTPVAVEIGAYTWIEECGLGIPLPAAPVKDAAFPRLLAGKRLDDARTAAVWELGQPGFAGLQKKLEAGGAAFSGSEKYPFRPRRHSQDVAGRRSSVVMPGGHALVLDWTTWGRSYALVVTDARLETAQRRTDELVRELVQLEGVEQDCIAPLMFQGRYACILKGWSRDGERLRRLTPQGWMSLRIFQVPLTDFENIDRVQFEVEVQLKAAGFERSEGLKPAIAGSEGMVGEYHAKDGFLQRIAFGKLDNGYLVALMQAPEAMRKSLSDDMNSFARSVQATGLDPNSGTSPLYFSRVRNVRCLAWQDGRRVLWGALFDDGRQQPVLWRQDGVTWNLQVTKGGTMLREREGTVNSSRALNPLVDAEMRAIDLPDNLTGDLELQLTVNGERTTTRITIR